MSTINDILFDLVLEDAKSSRIKDRLIYAIQNRHPVSFYYNGKSGDVLAGRRIQVEVVAMGLTKKGNPAIRGWVKPPSVSKKGFSKHGWRTFILGKMSNLTVDEDIVFNQKRPGYKEGDDNSFEVTDYTVNWGSVPEPKKVEPTPEPTRPEPKKQELPQPKPKDRPSPTPDATLPNRGEEVYGDLKQKFTVVNNQRQVSPTDFKDAVDDLYNKNLEDWVKVQGDAGLNTNPGEGTRRRMEVDAENQLLNLMKRDSAIISDEQLQENINRIKTLMLS